MEFTPPYQRQIDEAVMNQKLAEDSLKSIMEKKRLRSPFDFSPPCHRRGNVATSHFGLVQYYDRDTAGMERENWRWFGHAWHNMQFNVGVYMPIGINVIARFIREVWFRIVWADFGKQEAIQKDLLTARRLRDMHREIEQLHWWVSHLREDHENGHDAMRTVECVLRKELRRHADAFPDLCP